jgi:hypothetical protein
MQLICESRLFAVGADFAGAYAPYQGIYFCPGPGGAGVIAAASNRGALTFVGYDAGGTIDEPVVFIPTKELAAASRGLKSGPRTLSIDTEARIAAVTTPLKTKAGTTVEMAAPPVSQVAFPDVRGVIARFVSHWESMGQQVDTCGRYDAKLLLQALRAAEGLGDSVSLVGLSGGPLLINIEASIEDGKKKAVQTQSTGLLLMLMPQTAQPVPPPPSWARRWGLDSSASEETQDTGCATTTLVGP